MAVRNIEFGPDRYFHIFNEGCHSDNIFLDIHDYAFFIDRLTTYSAKYKIELVSWCLMPNHYHVLARQVENAPAGVLPRFTCNSYTKYFNKRHGRRGALFAACYKAKPIRSDRYLAYLTLYIHGNPAVAGFVPTPSHWPYSNHALFLSAVSWPKLDTRLKELFGDSRSYRESLDHYVDKKRAKTRGRNAVPGYRMAA